MQQDKALQILKENLPSFAEEYGVKKIGVFPYEENNSANCECECGNCCGYHPDIKIGVAVEYKPDARPGFDFFGLQNDIADLLGCDIILEMIGGYKDSRFKQPDNYMKDVVYVE